MLNKRISKNSPSARNTVFDIHPPKGSGWNRPRKMVSLRRHLYRRHPVLTSIGALAVVLAVVITADTFQGHANTVFWYPKSCLGGWTSSANAAGAPELSPLAEADEFTADNSAILEDSLSQIFCGEFEGDMPLETTPDAVVLSISWTFKTVAVPAGVTQSDSSDSTEVTPTEEIIEDEANPSSTPVVPVGAGTQPETPSEAEQIPEPETVPEPAATPEPESTPTEEGSPAAWLFNLARLAFAQEAPASEEVVAEDPGIVQEVVDEQEQVPAEEAASQEETMTPEENAAQEEIAPQEEEAAAPDAAVGEVLGATSTTDDSADAAAQGSDEGNLLEIRYSTDGESWESLGAIRESNWQNTEVSIPVTDWEGLKKLQISLVSFPVSDLAPVVYLDGMSLTVSYDPVGEPVPEEELIVEEVPLEEEIIVPEEPLAPPLDERKVPETIKIDQNAKHSCAAEPFRIDVSDLASTTARIILQKDGSGLEEVGIGYLPKGIDAIFAKSGYYIYRPGKGDVSLDLEITKTDISQKGDFNIPIIYTKKGAKDSSVVCQLNIINR